MSSASGAPDDAKIRVAIFLNSVDEAWLGGVNHNVNVIGCLLAAPNPRLELVLVAQPGTFLETTRRYPHLEVVRTSALSSGLHGDLPRSMRRVLGRFPAALPAAERIAARVRDHWLQRVLDRAHIEIALVGYTTKRLRTPMVAWLQDFQHVRLPHLFTASDLADRDATFRQVVARATLVFVSSESARRDFAEFSPEHVRKCRVFRFVAVGAGTTTPTPMPFLRERYRLPERFFLLPNQFWVHKNHETVIDALARARDAGRPMSVIATGLTSDYRDPSHFDRLMQLAVDRGVAADFRALGVIPYPDVIGLMHGCIALMNPSSFEGWSTSVEEAKALGRPIVLSDIPVHREQAPPLGRFFELRNPAALEAAMSELWDQPPIVDEATAALAKRTLEIARRDAGVALERILLEAVGTTGASSTGTHR